jgi:hypothetical protein
VRKTYQPVLVEWDDSPFARKRFLVWTPDPGTAFHFTQEWFDYVERVGVSPHVEHRVVQLDFCLDESELERLWPGGGGSENLTGERARRMRDLLELRGRWRRARILWDRE